MLTIQPYTSTSKCFIVHHGVLQNVVEVIFDGRADRGTTTVYPTIQQLNPILSYDSSFHRGAPTAYNRNFSTVRLQGLASLYKTSLMFPCSCSSRFKVCDIHSIIHQKRTLSSFGMCSRRMLSPWSNCYTVRQWQTWSRGHFGIGTHFPSPNMLCYSQYTMWQRRPWAKRQ